MSMTDRELIELAALAASIDGGWGEKFMIDGDEVDLGDIWFTDSPETCAIWDPLEDDAAALRLAMTLGICIQFIPECDTVQAYQERKCTGEAYNVHVAALGDIELRRCIVTAAAEIGKAMQEKK